jgi:hypothetical protein
MTDRSKRRALTASSAAVAVHPRWRTSEAR